MELKVWSRPERQYVIIEIPDEEIVSIKNILKTHKVKTDSGMSQEEFNNSEYVWIEMTEVGCNIFDSYDL